MSAARTERLLNLLTLLLNTRRPISLRELRELDEFGAYRTEEPKSGERAFERDKVALLELGVPLRWISPEQQDDEEGTGGYVIDRDRYFLPDVHLSASELALLSMAGAAAAALEGFSGKAAVIRALAKLGFATGDVAAWDDAQSFEADMAAPAPTLAHAPLLAGVDAPQLTAHLEVLHDAVARKRQVQLIYRSGVEVPSVLTRRQVNPYGVYYRQGLWYMVGFCQLRQAERTFNLGRTEALWGVGPVGAFAIPEGFHLKDYLERRPWAFPQEPACRVRIRLAERLRPAIGEIFGKHVHIEETAEGPVVQMRVSHQEALLATVLPYGAAAEVLEPASLRHRLGTLYAALAQRYADEAGMG